MSFTYPPYRDMLVQGRQAILSRATDGPRTVHGETIEATEARGSLRITAWQGLKVVRAFTLPFLFAFMALPASSMIEASSDLISGTIKEAIRQGGLGNAPYTIKGRHYVPMTVTKAKRYGETGIASWYGEETRRKKGGEMTANGEPFNPRALTGAHKYLPLPTHVLVTNLENGRSIVVRVNDRGPFSSKNNPLSGKRIVDLSWGAAKRLGFASKGIARVRVETIN